MVLVAAFTLRALKKTFFGDDRCPATQQGRVPIDADWDEQSTIDERITLAEKLGASLLIFATLAVGLYPKLLLDRIMPAVEAMRFLQAMNYLELLQAGRAGSDRRGHGAGRLWRSA